MRERIFDSVDGGEDGEHTGVDFVEMSKMYAMPDACYFGTESFDRLIVGHWRLQSQHNLLVCYSFCS